MINFGEDREKLFDMLSENIAVNITTGDVATCNNMDCLECVFATRPGGCVAYARQWLFEHFDEIPISIVDSLNQSQKATKEEDI